ncbi:hypothetical protein ScPMuIL_012620 [Solemya velum]
MSEVDISEELPNGDDSAFTEDQQDQHASVDSSQHSTTTVDAITTVPEISAEHVFVATSQGLLTAEHIQNALKTTHIVIHDQTLNVESPGQSGLKTPNSPLPPPTPATPLSKAKGFRYQWDTSVQNEILPVRCKNTNGELHKSKFGSGGRGKCIKGEDGWFTPNEFESMSGRASSKDWKRSIRYGGRTLQCLIEDGILEPHATSCTCAACCDDETVTGPVRLFVPYKRRKKDSESGPLSPALKKARPSMSKSPGPSVVTSPIKEGMMVSLAGATTINSQPIRMAAPEGGETVQIVTTDAAGNIVTGDAVVMTPIPMSSKPVTAVSMDVSEQKQWWQLEEMVNSLMQHAQQLKIMIEQVKQQSLVSKDMAIQQVRAQLEKEKLDALHAARIESQVNLSRMFMEERAQKDLAVQQALSTARAEMQEKMDSVVVVSSEKVATYNDAWEHQESSQNNIESIIDGTGEEDSDKEKE